MMMTLMEVDKMDLRISWRLWCYARSWTHAGNEILCIIFLCTFTFGCISNRMRRGFFDWTVLINPNAHPFEVRIVGGEKASNQSRSFLSTASAAP